VTDTKTLIDKLDADQKKPADANYWSQTYSGAAFYYNEGSAETNPYFLEDIAHHLATINRYGGAAIYPYSVAQHSVALSVAIWDATHDPVLCLDALFHDAEEAFTGDLRTPIKDRCPEFRAMARPISAALRLAMRVYDIDVPLVESDIVRAYDRRIIANERTFVMRPADQPWYGMEGFEPIPDLPPSLFEEKHWRTAKKEWLNLLDAYAVLAKAFAKPLPVYNFGVTSPYNCIA